MAQIKFDFNICGIDEAGRGALAGELVMCGCVFNEGFKWQNLGLNDSKQLTAAARERLNSLLLDASKAGLVEHLLVFFNNRLIDQVGLSECLRRGLEVFKHKFRTKTLIFDGNCNYHTGVQTLVKADAQIPQVSAASILAKVARDAQMTRFARVFENVGYEIHKGYATKQHLEFLHYNPPTPITRLSFCKNIYEARLF